jgi:hypothetical protein
LDVARAEDVVLWLRKQPAHAEEIVQRARQHYQIRLQAADD